MDIHIARDIFHTTYRELTEVEDAQLMLIKTLAADLYAHIGDISRMHSEVNVIREVHLAQARLEEAVMWAGKAMTRQLHDPKHN